MNKLQIEKGVAKDLRKLVSNLLERVSAPFLIPDWMHRLTIFVRSGKRKERAETKGRFHYGDGYVTIKSGLLTETRKTQDLIMMHELAHLPLEPIHQFVFAFIHQYVEDDKAKVLLAKQAEEMIERATEDVALAYARLKGYDV